MQHLWWVICSNAICAWRYGCDARKLADTPFYFGYHNTSLHEYASLDQSSCEWIRADARHLNLTIQHLPDFGLQLCKSIPDIPWHHTSIRIQQIPESSRINAVSAKNIASCVCVCILRVTGKVYTYSSLPIKHFTVSKKKERRAETSCSVVEFGILISVHLFCNGARSHKVSAEALYVDTSN